MVALADSQADVPRAEPSLADGDKDYASLWSRMHQVNLGGEGELVERQEWHLRYSDLQPVIEPYVKRAVACAGEQAHIVDVGCGTSGLGLELLEDVPSARLTLVDVVDSLIGALSGKHQTDQRVTAIVDDCRALEKLELNSVAVAVDKGTLDALDNPEDRKCCLHAVARILQRPHGLFVTVSFATPTRILFLRRELKSLGLMLRLRLVRAGLELRLVALISQCFGDIEDALDEFTQDQLSELLFKGPLRNEPFVSFEHERLPEEIVLEQVMEQERKAGDDDATGNFVWPAAHAFAAHLCTHPELVQGQRVVELGAGTGLAGLVAAALGASEVVLTDLAGTLPLLERNVSRNASMTNGRARATELRWGAGHGPGADLANFDLVIGCELVYRHDAETAAALVESMVKLAGADGICLFIYEFRGGLIEDMEFFDRAEEHFEVETMSLGCYGYGIPRNADDDGDSWRMLYIYRPKCRSQAAAS